MIYTVVWKPAVENDLATEWMTAPDKAAVANAANLIDAILRKDPYAYSESRDGATRVMFVAPLAVAFEVSEPDCLVTVKAVWRIS